MGTPNKKLQECSRNIIEYKDTGRYIPFINYLPTMFLGFPVWGSYLKSLQVKR